MAPQHTPGPWRFDGDWHRLPTIFGANGETVATIEKDGFPERHHRSPAQADNARLIAAAPELFEALRGVAACMLPGDCGWSISGLTKLRPAIHAAIAKASGEHP